jgi:hypothetical protein
MKHLVNNHLKFIVMKNSHKTTLAYKKGYRVKEGKVVSPNGVTLSVNYVGNRPRFKIRDENGKSTNIYVSNLLGYQNFGDKMFQEEMYIYHKNGNPKDNSEENIKIGSYSDAQMSKSAEVRLVSAIIATESARKHNHEEIIEMRKSGMSYEQIMNITGIKSKGTISFICNKSISKKYSDV